MLRQLHQIHQMLHLKRFAIILPETCSFNMKRGSRVFGTRPLDPTVDELRKLCTSLRKSARNERVLLHYNGHGVLRPTRNGELWVSINNSLNTFQWTWLISWRGLVVRLFDSRLPGSCVRFPRPSKSGLIQLTWQSQKPTVVSPGLLALYWLTGTSTHTHNTISDNPASSTVNTHSVWLYFQLVTVMKRPLHRASLQTF